MSAECSSSVHFLPLAQVHVQGGIITDVLGVLLNPRVIMVGAECRDAGERSYGPL